MRMVAMTPDEIHRLPPAERANVIQLVRALQFKLLLKTEPISFSVQRWDFPQAKILTKLRQLYYIH